MISKSLVVIVFKKSHRYMMPIVKKYTIKTECEICFDKLSKVVNSMLMYKVNNLF